MRRCIIISVDKSGNNKDFNILIERLKSGDPLAFDEIYKQCRRYVAFVCSKFCDNKEDAEEIVQDTFTIAFKKAGELRGETLLPYLRKIAVNKCYHNCKKNTRRQEHVSYLDEQLEDPTELDINFLPEEYLQSKESQAIILRIIKQLPQKQREMVYLYYYVDMNMEEIANLHDCSINNVSKTLRTARNTMKNKLEVADKKRTVSMVSVSIAAVLFMEETAFAASYVGTASASIRGADIAGKAAVVTAKSAKVYVNVHSIPVLFTVTVVSLSKIRIEPL